MDLIFHSKILEVISHDDLNELASYDCNLPFIPNGTILKFKGKTYSFIGDRIILGDGLFRHVFYVKDISSTLLY